MPPKHIVFRSGCIGSAKHCVMRGEGYWQVTGGPKAAVHSTILLALRRTCYWQVAGGPKAAVHSTILLARSCENDWQVAGGHKAAAHCANSELRGKIGRDQNGKSGVKPGVHSHKHSCIPSFVVDYNGLQHYREVQPGVPPAAACACDSDSADASPAGAASAGASEFISRAAFRVCRSSLS